jgi:DNA invertase Pin-like site-specific DNA recombinase
MIVAEKTLMELIPAAQYLRVSTERQEYSLEGQEQVIASWASEHGFAVSRTYRDEGKSGLDLAGRAGLAQLLHDVVSGRQSYKAVLVYDVSRWGRFQDPDEAAHYEFLCREAGVELHYCAELFSNNGEFSGTILKALKRVMAGEYSRELSQKVVDGLIRLVKKGFRSGSLPGYGFRRMLVSANGTYKQVLSPGERKSIATDRVVLVPGPADEIAWVREIYRMFVEEDKSFVKIAEELKQRKVPLPTKQQWNQYTVKRILTHPKYCGTAVYNRTTERLRAKSRPLPKSDWVVMPNAFEAIVPQLLYEAAQQKLMQKFRNQSNAEVLEKLKAILEAHGRLTHSTLKQHRLSPSAITHRFGSLIRAYELSGYKSPHLGVSENRRSSHGFKIEVMRRLVEIFPAVVCTENRSHKTFLKLKGGLRVAVRICRSLALRKKGRVWVVQHARNENCRVTLLVGLNAGNSSIEAFFLSGRLGNRHKIHITERHELLLKGLHISDLNQFMIAIGSRNWK